MTSSGRDGTSLLRNASGALAWSFVNTAVSRLGTLAIGIVLARVLGPSAFGTYAVAYVALIALLSFNELGVSLAIVRWPGEPEAIAPTVTTISVVSSAVITLAGYLAAPTFTASMGDPRATPVVRLLLLTVLVSGIVATPVALMQRGFRQDRKMIADQVSTWVGAVISIGLALTGTGAMSLAIGRLVGVVVSAVMFIRYSPLPFRFGYDRSLVRPLMAFGLPLAGASVIVFAVGSTDQFVVGKVLGSTALGFYVLAFNLSSWPVNMFSQPLRSVAPAAFARLQHDPAAMQKSLRSVVGLLAALTLPVCLLLAGAARPVIEFVYGPRWLPAAAPLTWLALMATFRIFFELAYDYLVVLGVSRSILVLQTVSLVALVPALVVGARLGGITGVAASQVLVAAVVMLPLYGAQFRRVGVSAREGLQRLWVPAGAAVLIGLAAAGIADTVHSVFGALVAAGLLTLAGMAALLFRERSELGQLRSVAAASGAVPPHVQEV